MADDLSSKLNGILSDPAALQQIMSVASGLMGQPKSAEISPPPESPGEQSVPALSDNVTNRQPAFPVSSIPKLPKDDRCELLSALKPFLREERAGKIDMLIRVLQISKLVKRR